MREKERQTETERQGKNEINKRERETKIQRYRDIKGDIETENKNFVPTKCPQNTSTPESLVINLLDQQ